MDKLLTAIEVAEYIGCSDKAIYAWAKRGELRSYKIKGLLRFKSSDVVAMVEDSRVETGKVVSIRSKKVKGDDVDKIVSNAIASVKGEGYNTRQRGNQTSQARKGGNNGAL